MRIHPVRFTDQPEAMQRFLEVLGLSTTITSDSGAWVSLRGSGGGVGLHAAASSDEQERPGETSLSFESDEPLEAVRDRLAAAGHASEIIDETFGRSLRVADPDGVTLQINETEPHPYGYKTLAPHP